MRHVSHRNIAQCFSYQAKDCHLVTSASSAAWPWELHVTTLRIAVSEDLLGASSWSKFTHTAYPRGERRTEQN